MDDFAYSLATLPEPARILHLDLLPFSIGHRLLLTRIESPFLADEIPSYADTIKAVLICADTYEAGSRIHRDVFASLKIKLWTRRFKGLDLDKERARFANYIHLGSLAPELKPGDGSGRPAGAPWILRLKNFIQFKLQRSESEAWNFPYGRAQFEYAAYYEEKGQLKIYNQDELDFRTQIREMQAAKEAAAASSIQNRASSIPGGQP